MVSTSSSVRFIPDLTACLNRALPGVAITPEVSALLSSNAVVAIGVSGGRDSQACAIAVNDYLDSVGHTGQRVLVHSDLGSVEWEDSIKICRELADHLGMELMVVRRKAGGMMERWMTRWENSVRRYQELDCVKLIPPWSTPVNRFCTSELKVDVITSALKKRYPGQDIVNVAGIRREESSKRRGMPVSKVQTKLKQRGKAGVVWNAIIEWTSEDVLAAIAQAGLRLHEAYTTYGTSRVSCVFCIMSAQGDLRAAAACADNLAIYCEMVTLEIQSGYAFQGGYWLADVSPHLLPTDLLERVAHTKAKAAQRCEIEARIPDALRYCEEWPTRLPSYEEALLLAEVRADVGRLYGFDMQYTTAEAVLERYAILMAKKTLKKAAKLPTTKRQRAHRKAKNVVVDEGPVLAAVE